MTDRWEAVALPGSDATEKSFDDYLKGRGAQRRVLNCCIPRARALELTRFSLPTGVTISDCLAASVKGSFPEALRDWTYEPRIRAVPQSPLMKPLPTAHRNLGRLPWFNSPGLAKWLAINARHLRGHYDLWQDLKPSILQGVQTTLILAMPQIGFSLTPRIQTEPAFLFLASLARGLGPMQLFPARYLYPEAKLHHLADAPAPIFSDILPTVGGFSFPVVEGEPDPWRSLAYFDRTDRFYGYPLRLIKNASEDITLDGCEQGAMLTPNGKRVTARQSKSQIYATLDPELNAELQLSREAFRDAFCLSRGTVTHDGLPFNLPVAMQAMVYAITLTHWRMELDTPGNLESYTLATRNAAIRGFNFFQRVSPYYENFLRGVDELARDSDFCVYPLSSHLSDAYLGGNVQVSNQLSRSERELGPNLMRHYHQQQASFQFGLINLMQDVAFRSKLCGEKRSRTGTEIERAIGRDAIAFHQLRRCLRFDSHLFPRSSRKVSRWPGTHPGFEEMDRELRTECLPKL